VLSVDADGRVVEANEAAVGLLRRSVDDLVANGWEPSIHPEDLDEVDDARRMIAQGQPQAEAVVRADVEGRVHWLHLAIVALGERASDGFLVAFDDISERHRATTALTHRATHDPLTGLPNRTLLEDRLATACARLGPPDRNVTLLFGDLDRFKEINDRLGHQVGDEVLRQVATRLQRVVRGSDTVTRLGGDEFVVVCEDLLASEAAEMAHRIASVVREPIDGPAGPIHVSISVGIVSSDTPRVEPLDLLARADAEMYVRKGRRPGPEGTAR
jgi:diguanylate cyclase (GGDEF)-like protein/PAS domain S-box-containing protein